MSQGWIENRLIASENRLEKILRQIEDLYAKVNAAAQAARTASQQFGPGAGGASGGAFSCQPSALVNGATGTWPAITPVSFTADVYQMKGGVLTLLTAGATCWNGLPASLAAAKVCTLVPDGTGAFVVYSQSCT